METFEMMHDLKSNPNKIAIRKHWEHSFIGIQKGSIVPVEKLYNPSMKEFCETSGEKQIEIEDWFYHKNPRGVIEPYKSIVKDVDDWITFNSYKELLEYRKQQEV